MECFIAQKENVDLASRTLRLVGDEAHHAVKSLRLRVGESFLATDLEGMCYRCVVDGINGDGLNSYIEEVLPDYGEPKQDILLIQGLISQPARWEFLLEKATELGVREIQPVTTERTERENFNRDRSERILRAAVKQTKRARMPKLAELTSFEQALTIAAEDGREIYLLHEGEAVSEMLYSQNVTAKIAIAIGPEGGFSDSEVDLAEKVGAKICSLGPRRLRAETAALAAIAILIDDKIDG